MQQKITINLLIIIKKSCNLNLANIQISSFNFINKKLQENPHQNFISTNIMNYQQNEQYMSQPVDEMSESSYIKINKKFLQCLKGVNDMDDLSQFRQNSDQQQSNNQSFNSEQSGDNSQEGVNSQQQGQQQQRQIYSTSSHQYKYYKDFNKEQFNNNEKSLRFTSLKNQYLKDDQLSQNSTKNIHKKNFYERSFQKLKKSPYASKDHSHSKIDKKQTITPIDNTFQYYLMRRSHSKKFKDTSKHEMDDIQNDLHEKSTKYNRPFSPQHRFSASNRFNDASFNLQQQMQRINYKKLLENEISKNKQLQRHIYKLQSKLTQMNLHYDQSFKSAKRLQKDLLNSQKVRKQNRHRMKQLDGKLQGLKTQFKTKKTQNQQKILNYRKENKLLKQQNQKYRIFVQTLSQSIYVLKGHKPKGLQDIWEEWKLIFQTFSKKKWTKSRGKSPNFKL